MPAVISVNNLFAKPVIIPVDVSVADAIDTDAADAAADGTPTRGTTASSAGS